MKKRLGIIILLICSIFQLANAQSLKSALEALPSVKSVEVMKCKGFTEKYMLRFEQPLDHKHPEKGTFLQRVFVCNVNRDSSTVIVTEGYGAAYAMRDAYRDELSVLFNLNNVVVEHRYFLESTPEGCDWQFLTAENAAADYHKIVTELKTIYKKKWIDTGISKGGQNSVIYRSFYPKDMDLTVAYVGPFCRSREDGRHEPFIAEFAGTPQDRKAIKDFQTEYFKRKKAILPWFDSLCTANNYKFRSSMEEAYEYTGLEFSFSYWQWGYPTKAIPSNNASDREIFNFMMRNCGPDYWDYTQANAPFYVMAAHELGYYGYDIEPFKEYLSIKSTKGYLERIWLPKELIGSKFDKTLSKKLDKFIRRTKCDVIFIYGEFDPWSAVRAGDKHRDNVKIFIDPAGSHRARIRTLPEDRQSEVKSLIANKLYN